MRFWGIVAVLGVVLAACSAPGAPVPTAAPTAAPPTLPLVTAAPASPLPTAAPSLPPTVPPAATPAAVRYTVQAGDTMLSLAVRFGVPMAAIQLANDLGESIDLYVGQVLLIPPAEAWEGASPFWTVHLVRRGETLSAIASACGVPLHRLLMVNHLSGVEPIHVGDAIILPREALPTTPLPPPTATPSPPTPTPSPASTVAPTPPPPSPAPGGWPSTLYRLINETRADNGLPPLRWNATLAAAAQAHAEDCAARGWGSHVGSDGADLLTRLRRAGYEGSGWAECWAQSLSPQDALEAWMDETPPDDPHRRTLLSTWLTEIGIGVAQADWGYFFIADFGR